MKLNGNEGCLKKSPENGEKETRESWYSVRHQKEQ